MELIEIQKNISDIKTYIKLNKTNSNLLDKEELISNHSILCHYLYHNIWTLTHPEDQLKKDFAKKSLVKTVLEDILGIYFICALEWSCSVGTGDIVVFDGNNTFFVIELKTKGHQLTNC